MKVTANEQSRMAVNALAVLVVDLAGSSGLVLGLGWRWTGLDGNPMDAGSSFMAFLVIGSILAPAVWIIYALLKELAQNAKN